MGRVRDWDRAGKCLKSCMSLLDSKCGAVCVLEHMHVCVNICAKCVCPGEVKDNLQVASTMWGQDQTQVHLSGSTASVLTNCAITPIPKQTWIEPGIMVPTCDFSIQGVESKRIMSLRLAG